SVMHTYSTTPHTRHRGPPAWPWEVRSPDRLTQTEEESMAVKLRQRRGKWWWVCHHRKEE
ncbi:MAG: hypothetical protein ACE5JU_23660, partial [Candidatus Binatia bacterium]